MSTGATSARNGISTLGIKSDNLVPREQGKDELAFYSLGTTDIEYMFPFSDEPQELEGVAHRGDYDLSQHAKHSGKADDLAYFDEELWNNDSQTMATRSFKEWLKSNPTAEEIAKYKFVPHVIEPSAGADRFTLAVLTEAYSEDQVPDAKGKLDRARRHAVPPATGPHQVRGLPAREQGRDAGESVEAVPGVEAVLQRRVRRQGGRRPSLPATR